MTSPPPSPWPLLQGLDVPSSRHYHKAWTSEAPVTLYQSGTEVNVFSPFSPLSALILQYFILVQMCQIALKGAVTI